MPVGETPETQNTWNERQQTPEKKPLCNGSDTAQRHVRYYSILEPSLEDLICVIYLQHVLPSLEMER